MKVYNNKPFPKGKQKYNNHQTITYINQRKIKVDIGEEIVEMYEADGIIEGKKPDTKKFWDGKKMIQYKREKLEK